MLSAINNNIHKYIAFAEKSNKIPTNVAEKNTTDATLVHEK